MWSLVTSLRNGSNEDGAGVKGGGAAEAVVLVDCGLANVGGGLDAPEGRLPFFGLGIGSA